VNNFKRERYAMATVRLSLQPTLSRALVLGFLGGVALILVTMNSTRGALVYVPYAALLAALAALLARHRALPFKVRFRAGLAGFMAATALLYVYILLWASPTALSIPLWGHAWRLGLMVAIGAVLCAAIAFVTE